MTVQEKLQKLDEMYAEGNLNQAEKQLKNWIGDADLEFEKGAKLTFYNELIGLYRTTGRAKQGAELAEEALKLVDELGAAGTVSHGTTLLNAATVYARAQLFDRSLELYAQAADIFAAQGLQNSYQMAGLFNNMSRIYGEKGDDEKALSFLEEALKIIHHAESSRASYYNYYTGKRWGDAASYDLCVDASILGIDATEQYIADFIRKRFQLQ